MNPSKRIRLPRISTIIACVALFAALSGSALAAKHLITGKQVAKNTLKGKHVKDGSLSTQDLSAATVSALEGQQGPKGIQGPQGPQGPAGLKGETGKQGPAGVVAPLSAFDVNTAIPANSAQKVVTLNVPAKSYAVTATGTMTAAGVDVFACYIEANGTDVTASLVQWEPAANGLQTPFSVQANVPAGTTSLAVECETGASAAGTERVTLTAIPVS